jgi:NADH-quinone oxidoreductase subunit E
MEFDISKADEIIAKHGAGRRGLIPSLLEIQDIYHYLPQEALVTVAERLDIPIVQVHQVAEFYNAFSLIPRGRHIITVCQGTACHVAGGDRLFDQVGRLLRVEAGGTTRDMQFTLEGVNCLGCCSLGPVMTVDGKYFGHMTASKVERVLDPYREKEAVPHG